MTFSTQNHSKFGDRLSAAIRSWLSRGQGRGAGPETHRAYSHADLPRCPGAYALLAGVARR
jgi:hypothetical protein